MEEATLLPAADEDRAPERADTVLPGTPAATDGDSGENRPAEQPAPVHGWHDKLRSAVTMAKKKPGMLGRSESSMAETDNSLIDAIDGDADDFSTHEGLVVSVRRTQEGLAHSAGDGLDRAGFKMSWLFLGLSVALASWLAVLGIGDNFNHPMQSGGGSDSDFPPELFDVNDPVSAFISITALVYALIFASTFTEAQVRLDEIRRSLVEEASGVHTAMLLVRTLQVGNAVHKVRTLLLFGHYINKLSQDITSEYDPNAPKSSIDTLYASMPSLEKMSSDGHNDKLDRKVVTRIIDILNAVTSARSIRETAINNKTHWITYVFLFEMGFASVFGVLLLQFGNHLLNVLLPTIIIVSLFSSMIFLADLEDPFSGVNRVDISIFDRIRRSISHVLAEINEDEPTTLWVGHIPLAVVDDTSYRTTSAMAAQALEAMGGEEVEEDVGAINVARIFQRFGEVESITVRRKDRPPSWSSEQIGSWALVTFADSAGMERALAWSGRLPPTTPGIGAAGKGEPIKLLIRKADVSTAMGDGGQAEGGGGGGGGISGEIMGKQLEKKFSYDAQSAGMNRLLGSTHKSNSHNLGGSGEQQRPEPPPSSVARKRQLTSHQTAKVLGGAEEER